MSEALLPLKPVPCWFCGSKDTDYTDDGPPYPLWSVYCVDCGAEGPRHESSREAIVLWNAGPASNAPLPAAARALLSKATDALMPFAAFGGGPELQAYQELPDDVVVWNENPEGIRGARSNVATAGDVRRAREVIGEVTGKPVSMMHFRRPGDDELVVDVDAAARARIRAEALREVAIEARERASSANLTNLSKGAYSAIAAHCDALAAAEEAKAAEEPRHG